MSGNRTKDRPIQVYLSEKEHERLKKNIAKTGLSQSAYLRKLIDGNTPVELPTMEYHEFMRALIRIGTNLNQIARVAQGTHTLDAAAFNAAVVELHEIYTDIRNQMSPSVKAVMPDGKNDPENGYYTK